VLQEQPGSPVIEYAEKATRTQTFKGPYALALSSALARGTVGTGTDEGWVVARCVVAKEPRNIGVLTIVWEAGGVAAGAELPPLKFSCKPHRIPRPLKYNPRYAALTAAQLDAIDKALEADSVKGNQYYQSFVGVALALELFNKRKRGQESYMLYGLEYSYTTATWTLPALTLGGFIDTPDGPMAGALPAGASWLRLADDFQFTGSYYETVRSWIGSPSGDWDADIY